LAGLLCFLARYFFFFFAAFFLGAFFVAISVIHLRPFSLYPLSLTFFWASSFVRTFLNQFTSNFKTKIE
jgi:hypothetical protein